MKGKMNSSEGIKMFKNVQDFVFEIEREDS